MLYTCTVEANLLERLSSLVKVYGLTIRGLCMSGIMGLKGFVFLVHLKRSIAVLLASVLVACSGNEDSEHKSQGSEQTEAKLQTEKSKIADQIAKSANSDSALEDSKKHDSASQSVELRKEASDDEVAESEDEAELENANLEDPHVEPYEGSTVRLLERSEGYIEWQPPSDVAYSKADVVVVAPSGERVKYSFDANEAMVLDSSLPDGLYKWESVITPEIDPHAMDQMRSVRETGNLQAQTELKQKLVEEGSFPSAEELSNNRQSGAFTVRDGVVKPTSSVSDGEDG